MIPIKTYKNEFLGEEYHEIHHKSGLCVYVFPKKFSVTHAQLAVRYGSAYNVASNRKEPPYPHGIAHFLEHKLFANEDGSDAFDTFSALGADANAYTTATSTVYLFSTTENPEKPLAELLRFVTHPYFTPENVEKEKGIIAEEIRGDMDNHGSRCYTNMLDAMYYRHPVKVEVAGTLSSIKAITAEMLYDCYEKHYRLSNMFLVVCGDVTVEQVMAVVDAELPEKPSKPPVRVAHAREARSVRKHFAQLYGDVSQTVFSIGFKDWNLPRDSEALSRRDAAMHILLGTLFSQSGELYHELYDNGLIATGLGYDYYQSRDFGFVQLSSDTDDHAAAYEAVMRYLDKVRKEGLCAEDFERRRRMELAEFIKCFDSTEEIADDLVINLIENDDPLNRAESLQSVTLEEATALFREIFCEKNAVLSVVLPKKEKKKKGE